MTVCSNTMENGKAIPVRTCAFQDIKLLSDLTVGMRINVGTTISQKGRVSRCTDLQECCFSFGPFLGTPNLRKSIKKIGKEK